MFFILPSIFVLFLSFLFCQGTSTWCTMERARGTRQNGETEIFYNQRHFVIFSMSMYLSWWGTVSFLFYKQGHFAIFSISIFFERWSRADSSNAGDIYDMGSRTVILALQVRDLVLHQYYLTSLHPDIIFYINIIWHPLLTLFDILYFFFTFLFTARGHREPSNWRSLLQRLHWQSHLLCEAFSCSLEMSNIRFWKIHWQPHLLCEAFDGYLEISNIQLK